jgi:hypothetical protein
MMRLKMTYKYLETEAAISMGHQFAGQFAKLLNLPILISFRDTNPSFFPGNEQLLWS